jgi:hypothetical protein
MSVFLMQGARNTSDWWLTYWINHADAGSGVAAFTSTSNLAIYGYISAGVIAITLARSFLFAVAGLRAAQRLHAWLLDRVVNTRVSFFDATPIGAYDFEACYTKLCCS